MSTKNDLADQFYTFFHTIHRYLDTAMTAEGVSLSKNKVLSMLYDHSPCRSTDIAEYFAFAPRSVTEAIDLLERDGLVVRRPDPTDRRAKQVSLTPDGEVAFRTSDELRARLEQHIFGALNEEQCKQLQMLIETLQCQMHCAPESTRHERER
jgi:DNA-binding MarR family transcriptional regulator